MIERIFIAIGSNIEPEINIPRALNLLSEKVRLIALSTFYSSAPVGCPGAPRFYNGAAEIETPLEPMDIKWNVLRPIEEALGRVRTKDRNAPRTMDLDLLLYGDRVISGPRLTLPDPAITRYPFILTPLSELHPGLILPGRTIPIQDLESDTDSPPLFPLKEFTQALRSLTAL
jgi:2-amino-4-hydroxy-6-hydroxymethyldihydropteridine diphosphokinase